MKKNKRIEISTLIGKGSKVTGELDLKDGIRVDGVINGSIKTNGLLIIGESGKAIADIEAEECIVSGTVCGNLRIKQTLELNKTAIIEGDIKANILKMEIGAKFDGKCSMKNEPPKEKLEQDKEYWLADKTKEKNESTQTEPI